MAATRSALCSLALLAACLTGLPSALAEKKDRGLKAWSGESSGGWGSVTTTDNHNGTSTTCTNTPYYNGCTTYPNGDKRRKLQAWEGVSSGSWGSVTTKNGDSYTGGRKLKEATAGRKLKDYSGSWSGSWGSTNVDVDGGGSSGSVNTPYYSGSWGTDSSGNTEYHDDQGGSSSSSSDDHGSDSNNSPKPPALAPTPSVGTVWYNGNGVLVQQLADGGTQTVVNTPGADVNVQTGK